MTASGEAAGDVAQVDAALATIGAFSDLEWDKLEDALERIRHESPPTRPITSL